MIDVVAKNSSGLLEPRILIRADTSDIEGIRKCAGARMHAGSDLRQIFERIVILFREDAAANDFHGNGNLLQVLGALLSSNDDFLKLVTVVYSR